MLSSIFESLTTFITELIIKFGYVGIFVISFLENVIPPIPSEFVFPWAGFVAGRGKLNIFLIAFAGALGSTFAALILYYLGTRFNGSKTREFVKSYGKYFFISLSDLEKAEGWFTKYGPFTIFICRIIPLARSVISVPAGFVKMNPFLFTLYTFVGTFIWSLILTYAGFILGENYNLVVEFVDQYKNIVVLALIILGGLFLYKKRNSFPLINSLFKK